MPVRTHLEKIVKTDQTKWSAALRQAVIRVKLDYFALSEAEREHYRLQLNAEDDFCIRQAVLKELPGVAVSTTEELDAVLDTFNDSQYLLWNSTLLPLQGIGEDDFFLNDFLPTDVTLLDFSKVGDYARDKHHFQEQARKQEDPDNKNTRLPGKHSPLLGEINDRWHFPLCRHQFPGGLCDRQAGRSRV